MELTAAMLNKSSWLLLTKLVSEGTEDQKDQILTWGWKNITADKWEQLVILAGRGYLLD